MILLITAETLDGSATVQLTRDQWTAIKTELGRVRNGSLVLGPVDRVARTDTRPFRVRLNAMQLAALSDAAARL